MGIISWQRVGKPTVLAEGYGKRLEVQKMKDHRGELVDFYFLERPSWSVVLPITHDGKVVVVRQFKQGSEEIMTELPAGQADFKGENPEDVVLRELREETGYEAGSVISLGECYYDSRSSHCKFHCFLAKDCVRRERQDLDRSEQIEYSEISLEEWAFVALRGATNEWDAVLLFLRALPHLGVDIVKLVKSHLPKFS